MNTQCLSDKGQLELEFQGLGRRKVVGKFDGGNVSTDGGALLLREVETRTGIIRELADCFTDNRDQGRIEHTVAELVAQRAYGIALGYEDLDDHDRLRADPLLAIAVAKTDPTGERRRSAGDRGKALAGKSTLNRLELSSEKSDRYKQTQLSVDRIRETLVSTFISITEMKEGVPKRLILDIDATDDIIHGEQEGKYFHAYYNNYCYLPLYIFCNGHPLCAKLRRSCIDPAKGSVEEFEYIISRLRTRWPKVRILVCGDSGFCRDYFMSWCEDNKVDYILGVAKNNRLKKTIGRQLYVARKRYKKTGKAARVWYKTKKSWRQERRVIGKAEHLNK